MRREATESHVNAEFIRNIRNLESKRERGKKKSFSSSRQKRNKNPLLRHIYGRRYGSLPHIFYNFFLSLLLLLLHSFAIHSQESSCFSSLDFSLKQVHTYIRTVADVVFGFTAKLRLTWGVTNTNTIMLTSVQFNFNFNEFFSLYVLLKCACSACVCVCNRFLHIHTNVIYVIYIYSMSIE